MTSGSAGPLTILETTLGHYVAAYVDGSSAHVTVSRWRTGLCALFEPAPLTRSNSRSSETPNAGRSLPETSRAETLGQRGAKGEGFVLREYKIGRKRMEPTGRMIRWHPGGGHHGEDRYWKVVNYNTVSEEIR